MCTAEPEFVGGTAYSINPAQPKVGRSHAGLNILGSSMQTQFPSLAVLRAVMAAGPGCSQLAQLDHRL